ncbi:zinc dependent phospholipase C family protein [Clostridiisalibacter paucivorans]|uniref:zinc dependent phospholipase C family protein n=1 Tax=Clostridiisalibacter paucivorans TaxID=408753 RepID=UPI00047D87E6|nr:zinc dependent phospholipase C family protein [Clostridiisalibacter paucivorans]
MSNVEIYYGKIFKMLLRLINPFKKKIIKTECNVHRFINYQSIKILNKYQYERPFEIFNYYMEDLNRGVVWADQDFKSIGHFYNPQKNKGLYGHLNALALSKDYYKKALVNWEKDNIENAMFYLGAAVHLIQDVTIPQHVNIRLLDSHRQYENFVKLTYDVVKEFRSVQSPILFNSIDKYINFNAKVALRVYKQYKDIDKTIVKFYKITQCALPLAQRTTAGVLLMFLREVGVIENKIKN